MEVHDHAHYIILKDISISMDKENQEPIKARGFVTHHHEYSFPYLPLKELSLKQISLRPCDVIETNQMEL